MKKKLSQNFWLEEFTNLDWPELDLQAQYMLNNLASNILQPIRDVLGPIKVTSGVRTIKDYHNLVAKGYNPSETSDHFFGAPVILRSPKKIKKYGKRYTYSVGASDIVPVDIAPFDAFKKVLSLWKTKKLKISFGQIIYEKQGSKEWIHISNPTSLIYSAEFIEKFLKKTPILQSLDGGKTYTIPKDA